MLEALEEHMDRTTTVLATILERNIYARLKSMLLGIKALRPQERTKQNRHKLSYYVPLQSDRNQLSAVIRQRFEQQGIRARLIWSIDEPVGIGLLDILPAGASKLLAIEFVIAVTRPLISG